MAQRRMSASILASGLLVVALARTAIAADATTRPVVPPRTPETATTPEASPRGPERHEQFMNRIKDGDIGLLFIGDSITDSWPRVGEYSWLKFAPYNPADFGVSGERTENVLWRIAQGELDGIHPKVVVLMIGTNNIGRRPSDKADWAAAGVMKVVQTIHEKLPDSKLLLLGVFPRNEKASKLRGEVEKMNAIISRLDDGEKIRYMDIRNVFLDKDGEIPADVMMVDKLHPTAKGYDLWYDAIHPVIDEMMK